MAKARMLHKKISLSLQVNKLCDKAKLIFTWMISHADDEGRLRGEAEYVKATVVPLTKWSLKQVENYLGETERQGLINRWEEKGEKIIQFVKWGEYQAIRKDRFYPSQLPPFRGTNGNQVSTTSQPDDNHETPQFNPIESNKNEIKANPKEENKSEEGKDAVKNHFRETSWGIDPRSFKPSNAGEAAALEAWRGLEPNNYPAFSHTYYQAYRRGLPTDLFYQFVGEIKQDKTVIKPGAVFTAKLENHFKRDKPLSSAEGQH